MVLATAPAGEVLRDDCEHARRGSVWDRCLSFTNTPPGCAWSSSLPPTTVPRAACPPARRWPSQHCRCRQADPPAAAPNRPAAGCDAPVVHPPSVRRKAVPFTLHDLPRLAEISARPPPPAAVFVGVAQRVQARLNPSRGLRFLSAFQRQAHSPQVLADVIKIQQLRRAVPVIRHQIPNPRRSVPHRQHRLGPPQTTPQRLPVQAAARRRQSGN